MGIAMQLDLGINTCFAVKRWPHAEDWIPIVRDVLGLRRVQHSLDLVEDGSPTTEAAAFGESVKVSGLELESTFTGLIAYSRNLLLDSDTEARARAESWFRWAIEWTAAAGAHSTGGHVGAFTVPDWRSPERRHDRWLGLRRALSELAGRAKAAGLESLLVENMAVAREPSAMADIRDLVTRGDPDHVPIRLCLDLGHMCVPGTSGADRDPYAWLRELGSVAPVIQLQQSAEDGDRHWPFTAAMNAIGRIDADRVVDALGEGGVERAALILEVIPPFERDDDAVVDDLRESVDYWRSVLARHGVVA